MAEELETMVKIRDDRGANHAYQMNFTPLVIYSNIALRHLERRTSIMNHNGTKTAGRFLDRTRGICRSKFNGKGSGTYIEQLILDFGPAGTDWIVSMIRDEGQHYVRFFGEQIRECAHRQLAKRGYDPLFFTPFRPKDWIFPTDFIDAFSPKLKEMWWDRTQEFLNGEVGRGKGFDKQLCLKTLANHTNTMTEAEARELGTSCDKNMCQGCGCCIDGDEIKAMTQREISDEHTVDEIAELLSTARNQKDVRIVVKVDPKWNFISKNALRFIVTSKFLEANRNIAESYYRVGKTNWSWVEANGGKSWGSGYVIWNVELKDNISVNEFTKVIDEVNSKLDVCKVIRVVDDTKTQKCDTKQRSLFICKTDAYSALALKEKINNWYDMNCSTPVLIKSMGGCETEKQEFPELKGSVFMTTKGKEVLLTVIAKGACSPYSILAGITGKSLDKTRQEWEIECIDTEIPIEATDDKGNKLGFSMVKGTYNKDSLEGYSKKLLYVLTH